MANLGDPFAKALAETTNGLYKTKLVHRQPWRKMPKLERTTFDWADLLNERRLPGHIGDILFSQGLCTSRRAR